MRYEDCIKYKIFKIYGNFKYKETPSSRFFAKQKNLPFEGVG